MHVEGHDQVLDIKKDANIMVGRHFRSSFDKGPKWDPSILPVKFGVSWRR